MEKQLIYDVGMYDGSDSLHYLKKGYNVVAIEADPVLAANAKKKYKKYIDSQKLTIVGCGVAEKNGTANFYINDKNPFWNSFDLEISSRDGLPYHTVQVECRNFAEILNEYKVPYYLKIDIEGHDKFCIEALDPANLPQYVSFEADNHGDTELLDTLYKKGYRKFQLINQNTFEPVTIPYESGYKKDKMKSGDRLFLKVMYSNNLLMRIARKFGARDIFRSLLNPSTHLTYNIGSSGPFGEDLKGAWLSYEEAKKLFVESYQEYEQRAVNKDYGYWADFHASL